MPFLPEWLQWYKKPAYQDLRAYANSLREKFEKVEENGGTWSPRSSFVSGSSNDVAVPSNLTFERVLNHRTCTPMSLYDFYMYLKHIEFSPENLEFYLWLKDYEKRYKRSRHGKEAAQDRITETSTLNSEHSDNSTVVNTIADNSSGEVDVYPTEYSQQFAAYIESIVMHTAAKFPRPCLTMPDSPKKIIRPTQEQERRRELLEVTNLFLTSGGDKELNIPPSMRKAAVTALVTSDSPEVFDKISDHVYSLLKNCSHRNFVRLGVNNGSFEHLCMVTFMGIMFSCMGFLTMFLLAFASPGIHQSSRWRGLYTIPFWLMGLSLLLAGWRGSCFFMLVVAHRQPLPWERLEGDQQIALPETTKPQKVKYFLSKLMFFDQKIRVKDVGLRRLQHKIALQSTLGALIGTTILEVFFLCLPIWRQRL